MSSIFVCFGTLESGGAERVLSVLSPYLADSFEEVTYVMWRKGKRFYDLDSRIDVIELPELACSDNIVRKALSFRRMIKERRPDLVISFLTPFNLLVLASLLHVDQKIAVAERNDPRFIKGGRMMHAIRRYLYNKADAIFCQTDKMAEFFTGSLHDKTRVIYNPLFIDSKLVGKALSTPKSKSIVSVGRLNSQKNYSMLIDGFNKFHSSHPDYILRIYGEGELRPVLQSKINSLGLADSVLLPGNDKNVHEKIADAQAFIMTSFFEGMPNALIEAMALGLPCISTKVSGATELISHRNNGLLIDTTVEAIAQSLDEIVSNERLRGHISQHAVNITSILDQNTISHQWVEQIRQIIND